MMTKPSGQLASLLMNRLQRELHDSRAFAAGLRHDAGVPLISARSLIPWYAFLEKNRIELPKRLNENAFLVATVASLDRAAYRHAARVADNGSEEDASGGYEAKKESGTSFARALRKLVKGDEPEGDPVARRFAGLIDGTLEEGPSGTLPRRLVQATRFMISKVDVSTARRSPAFWRRMLLDLDAWNVPEKPVQHRWVRDFYSINSDELANTETDNPNMEEERNDAD